MMPGNNSSYGGFDLQGSMRVNHHQQLQHYQPHSKQGSMVVHPTINANFPLTIGSMQDINQNISIAERGKSASDEDEPSFTTDDGQNDAERGKKATPWQRVKWTDQMVRLLITAVSYIGEETAAEYGGRRKCSNLHKKGKWKSVSKVMAERGHFVSPQQCEDKFNDLNKRYKRLNEILGRGTSCEVVENPALLDVLDHVSAKGKEEVRKILSSKHLHYEEMCSYHNGNRLHLPPDPELQHSLRLALRTRDEHDDSNDTRKHPQDNNDEDDHEADLEDRDEYEENHSLPREHRFHGMSGGFSKRVKQCQGHESVTFGNSLTTLDCNRTFSSQLHNAKADPSQMFSEGNNADMLQRQWMDHRSLQIEEQKLQIQAQMLELEKERFNWQRFSRKKDIELEAMRMENERMKLENERMALELKQKEMLADNV